MDNKNADNNGNQKSGFTMAQLVGALVIVGGLIISYGSLEGTRGTIIMWVIMVVFAGCGIYLARQKKKQRDSQKNQSKK